MSIRMAAATGAVSMWWPATGLSEESNEIRDQIEEIRRELRKPMSFSWRESLRHELADIVEKCSRAGMVMTRNPCRMSRKLLPFNLSKFYLSSS